MSIDSIIRESLRNHPDDWFWDGPRFLRGPGVTLCRTVINERWTFCVGQNLGYVELSRFTHGCIEMARVLKKIPNVEEADS